MKCPYCAEEIQEEAVLCRFCGAEKLQDHWTQAATDRDAGATVPRRGLFTIRLAGALFLLSAALEATSLQLPVVVAGSLHGGALAMSYHLFYVALFAGMGLGLWRTEAWGYRLMWFGTIIYTLDKLRIVLDEAGRSLEVAQLLDGYQGLFGPDELALVPMAMNATAVVSVLCWWGFLAYLVFRRDRFGLPARSA